MNPQAVVVACGFMNDKHTSHSQDLESDGAVGQDPEAGVQILRGTCHVYFAYDIGLSVRLEEAERRIAAVSQRKKLQPKRRVPQYFEYDPPPIWFTRTTGSLEVAGHIVSPQVDLMVCEFGAVSVNYKIPLCGPLTNLRVLADEIYDNPELLADSRRSVDELLAAIAPAVSKPSISELVEDYAIYQIEEMAAGRNAEHVVADEGQLLAQILRAESSVLSSQEVGDSLACRISFGECDLTIVDWNAALLFDTDADDVRAVLEYANIELLEMRWLDDQLDLALEESHDTLMRKTWHRGLLLGTRGAELRRIAEMQMDSALLFEGVNNALKLLGDQYLARVYRSASQRLHLNDWDTGVHRKLRILESIYEKIADHHANLRAEVLEWIIIILIAISILLGFH